MVRRGLKTTVIATVMAMMLAPSFSAFAQTGKSNTSGSWQVENNAWVFRNAEGQSVKGWVVYNQEWYYLNPENGQLKTGWLQLDGKWYFLSTESGAQQGRLLTGWQWIDGYCYYLMPTDDNSYGVLVVNGRTPDGYYVNQSGQWLHGENGDAVYEAGKGLPSAASSQQVAGASRALPGQVLGASRAIAAPGGGSFGGGGGGGSTGGGATTSTTGGAGTATAGAATGTATSGTSTGTTTGGSTAGAAGTASESATAGEATDASTGAEANASTGAESNASGGSNETSGTTTPSSEGTGAATGTETPGTETGGNNAEKPVETVTPGNPENTTQPGGNTTETSGETETSGNSETPTQPGNSGTETGGNAGENSGAETEAPTQPETETPVTQPEKPVEDSHEEEVSLKDWPFEYRFEYDAEKKSFLLFFGKNEDTKLVKEFLSRNVEVMVNDSHYELGDVFDDLTDAENKYIYALKWDIKERGYYNALRLARSAFHEGDNTVEFAPDGYKPLVFNFKVKRGMLQELKKLEKLQYNFAETVLPGSYDVKIVKFENLSAEQKACITGLKTLEVDGVSYTKVEDQRYEDLCADGRHAFMILNGTWDLAIGNPPKEYATHKISLHPEGYEDIEITYEKLENEPAPVFRKLEKKQGYYELSFQGSREDIQAYLTNIKKLTVAEREFGQMASFHADLLNMGEKYTFGDSEGKMKIEDLLLFSVPTANADKKQEIRIESEGYEPNTIPLS
ncbi:hypothetical protein [Oribacterium sinus]|uniref:hypothetical protein n=1 Tax=Oribacterium sinus TaxID=237576 RepID=UPI0028D8320E|nr:hypothetical protein [Oribacterium sinus]